jgi:hypothetical protein
MKKKFHFILLKVRRAVRRRIRKSRKTAAHHDNVAAAHGHHDIDNSKRNISRFFVEQRHITWVMLIGVCAWGFYSYRSMPQRKDPDTPVKTAVAITAWPWSECREDRATRNAQD